MRSTPLIIALLIGTQLLPTYAAERPKRPPPAVTAFEVKRVELPQTYTSTGTLVAAKQAELRTEVNGRIDTLHAVPGQQVEAGALLLTIDSRSARAEVERLESQLTLARQQLERQRSLVKRAAGAAEKVDIQSAEVNGIEANLRIARLGLERYELKAPFSGILGKFDWVEGGWITNSSAFATLDDTSSLKVDFDVPERYLRFIELGRSVELSTAAWPEQSFSGAISLIDVRMNAQRATLGVQAVVDNSAGMLRPGMHMSVTLRVDGGEEKLVVPARTLIHEGERTTVLRLDADSKARATTVKIGQETSEWVEITDGLTLGDRIIDRGLVKAKPNRPVSVLGEDSGREGSQSRGNGDRANQRPKS